MKRATCLFLDLTRLRSPLASAVAPGTCARALHALGDGRVDITHTTYAPHGDLSPRDRSPRDWEGPGAGAWQARQCRSAHTLVGWRRQRSQRQSRALIAPQSETLHSSSAAATSRLQEVVRATADRGLHGVLGPEEQLSLKAALLFEAGWRRVEEKWRGRYICPREVVWLNGAPGSGKGTNMPFIMKSRGLSRSLGMSQLLDGTPEIKSYIDRGELVPDALVLDALLDAVLNPEVNDGAGLVIDGFPRTALQVDMVKLLYEKLLAMAGAHIGGSEAWRFPRPSFKVVILYVDEMESLERQMRRAKLAAVHNRRVADAGSGDVWDVRTTDINEQLCRRRYQVFKQHYHTILRLKQFFPFSLIDAMGTPEECRAQIARELRYQSSLDLDAETYGAIRHLPLARDLVRVARQRLVFRLDGYASRARPTFDAVISLIEREVLPLLKTCSLAGHAVFRSRDPVLLTDSRAVDMLIDVLSDRGFSVAHADEDRVVPERVDLATGAISHRIEPVHVFRITFDKENVRDLSTPVSVTTREGEDVAIGATSIPSHMQRESLERRLEAAGIDAPLAAAAAVADVRVDGPDTRAVVEAAERLLSVAGVPGLETGAPVQEQDSVAIPAAAAEACHIDPLLSATDPVLGQDLAADMCGGWPSSVETGSTESSARGVPRRAAYDAAAIEHRGDELERNLERVKAEVEAELEETEEARAAAVSGRKS